MSMETTHLTLEAFLATGPDWERPLFSNVTVFNEADLDLLATQFYEKDNKRGLDVTHEKVTPLPDYGALLTINNRTITSKHAKLIRAAAISEDLIAYMDNKYKWKPTISSTIDWAAHEHSIKQLQPNKRTCIQKYIH